MKDDELVVRGDDVLPGIDASEIEGDDQPLPEPAAADAGPPADVLPLKYKVVPEGEP